MERLKLWSKRFLVWARAYFRENWGAPFVLGFIVILLVAAACLAVGLEPLANQIAVYAYYALAVGVILQLLRFLRDSELKKWKSLEELNEG